MAKSKAVELVESLTGVPYASESVPEGFTPVSFGAVLSKEGDSITGVYRGKGPVKKVKNKEVSTYKVQRADGAMVEILASSQVADFFGGRKEGDAIWIKRGPQVKGGKGRVNTFEFAFRAAE